MSQDDIGRFFPSEEPTFTADASLAFELPYGLWPAKGSSLISRLSCADPNVIDCFVPRDWSKRLRSQYHDSIPRDEYKCFKKPGRSGTNTVRVWTKRMTHSDDDYKSRLTTGNWEGHKFRYDVTEMEFEALSNEGSKWKNDVHLAGWVWLDGKIKVWVPNRPPYRPEKSTEENTEPAEESKPADGTNVPSILITEPEQQSGRAVTGWGTTSGDEKGRLQVPK